ncbi:hypothetical protein QO002_002534 [Pararhizobium capsulatum DSM 1112]|uniref:Flp pilus-assembly TadG-like N-terminal domain-containing protein n=1 Tax=Pararhizobium capsulatum DSM 1112 TaxID=1121113 RepID=A0ABU0BQ82_9HYPH|nr:hypothetical protein [Pararhizobium capsulatum]MDQ0320396.1 hypothetical protein [Pararhizobium capsulatum DSM 1112]
MAIAMMMASAVISIVFVVDFTKTIFQLQRDRADLKMNDSGFQV